PRRWDLHLLHYQWSVPRDPGAVTSPRIVARSLAVGRNETLSDLGAKLAFLCRPRPRRRRDRGTHFPGDDATGRIIRHSRTLLPPSTLGRKRTNHAGYRAQRSVVLKLK